MTSFSNVLDAAFGPVLSAGPSPFSELIATFIAGYREFERTGETPVPAYLAMRRLFCATNGEFNDLVHQLLSKNTGGGARPAAASGVLGATDDARLDTIVEAIGRDGFYVFEQRLPEEVCDGLRGLALRTPCKLGGIGGVAGGPQLYDRARLVANRYDLPEAVVAANADVQALLLDESIRAVATAYLGCTPILDFVSMWWVAPFSNSVEALSKAAQLYHFDMDRLKFLKFFIYLSDVTSVSSPHCYVRGSCRRKPRELLRDGRIPDDEIARHFPPGDLVELTAPRGSIFAVDTRGFHKGKAPEAGERLLLQLEFTNSLFGQNYGRIELDAEACTPRFQAYLASQSAASGRFHLASTAPRHVRAAG